jgi:hypothetical protein
VTGKIIFKVIYASWQKYPITSSPSEPSGNGLCENLLVWLLLVSRLQGPGGVCSTICHHLCTLYVCVFDGRPACVVTQAEASRALAHLLSDKNTCESVLGRPHALPYLLHFSASIKPHDGIEV